MWQCFILAIPVSHCTLSPHSQNVVAWLAGVLLQKWLVCHVWFAVRGPSELEIWADPLVSPQDEQSVELVAGGQSVSDAYYRELGITSKVGRQIGEFQIQKGPILP